MVGNCQPTACRREDAARNHATQMLREIRSPLRPQALPSQRGLDVRKNLPGNGGKCFLLTSPFIEPGLGDLLGLTPGTECDFMEACRTPIGDSFATGPALRPVPIVVKPIVNLPVLIDDILKQFRKKPGHEVCKNKCEKDFEKDATFCAVGGGASGRTLVLCDCSASMIREVYTRLQQ